MCYGNLDPTTMMREMDARLKPVTSLQKTAKTTKAVPTTGLFAPVLLALFGWTRSKFALAQRLDMTE